MTEEGCPDCKKSVIHLLMEDASGYPCPVTDTPPSYACALPFGFWFGAELQAGIDQFSQEYERDFYVFSANHSGKILQQPWIDGLIVFASGWGLWKQFSAAPDS